MLGVFSGQSSRFVFKNRCVGHPSAPRRGPSRLTEPLGGRRAGTPVTDARRHNPARLATKRQPDLAWQPELSRRVLATCGHSTRTNPTSLSARGSLRSSGARGPSLAPRLHFHFPAEAKRLFSCVQLRPRVLPWTCVSF